LLVQDHGKEENKEDQEQHEQITQRQKPDFVSGLGGDRPSLKTHGGALLLQRRLAVDRFGNATASG